MADDLRRYLNGQTIIARPMSSVATGGWPEVTAPAAVIRNTYDDRGRRISRAYFDHDGKPTSAGPASVGHKTDYRYDDRGNCIEEINYALDGKPNEEYGSLKGTVLRRGDKIITEKVPSGPSRVADATAARLNPSRFLIGFGAGTLVLPVLPTDSVNGLQTTAVHLAAGH